MLTNNFAVYGLKIISELISDVFMFPIWWYSRGFIQWSGVLLNFLREQQKSLGLMVWITNIHRPMYGQTDWQGIMISLFMRIFQIICRGFIMVFWLLAVLLLLIAWLAIPILIAYEIMFQLF